MTGLLEKALHRLERLSPEEQDAIAAQIIETLDDEAAWKQSFRSDPDRLKALAEEAAQEYREGKTRPIRELLGG